MVITINDLDYVRQLISVVESIKPTYSLINTFYDNNRCLCSIHVNKIGRYPFWLVNYYNRMQYYFRLHPAKCAYSVSGYFVSTSLIRCIRFECPYIKNTRWLFIVVVGTDSLTKNVYRNGVTRFAHTFEY